MVNFLNLGPQRQRYRGPYWNTKGYGSPVPPSDDAAGASGGAGASGAGGARTGSREPDEKVITILSVHKDLEAVVRASLPPGVFNGVIEYVEYAGITAMYGAAHCTTQVFRERSGSFGRA